MLRGINQQQIFEDSKDFEKFLQILKDCKAISECKIYAYCLMGNHIHLLMQEVGEPIEQVMKRLETRFVYWYNTKYQRVGHLFQDRFKSEPVEDESYLLTVIRYIHQNPIKAGICRAVEQYQYSSYGEYSKNSDLIDRDYIFQIISEGDFCEFNKETVYNKCLDIEDKPKIRVTDEQAQKIIEKYSKCKSVAEFQALEIKFRDKCLKKFREKGLSIRQIGRLTGISFGTVRKF